MDENPPQQITVRDLMPFVEPDGVAHIRLALRNMENAQLRAEIDRLQGALDVETRPLSNEDLHALLGDARTEPAE